jgi:hypothetical protein
MVVKSALSPLMRALAVGSLGMGFLHSGHAFAAVTVDIDPSFGSSNSPPTGSTAQLVFSNFAASGSFISFDLQLTNNSPNPPFATTFVGAVFDLPNYEVRFGNVGDSFSTLTYDLNSTTFEELWGPNGASLNLGGGPDLYDIGIRTGVASSGTVRVQDNPFTFNGGNPQGGLAKTQSATVRFSYDTFSTALTADVFEAELLSGFASGDLKAAGRFQQVVITEGGQETSDKVGGGIVQQNGVSVPGPLPLFGAAAAFGYSRKLRHRVHFTKRIPPQFTAMAGSTAKSSS